MNYSSRIATLLFLKSRNEISPEEETELNAWRTKSPDHEKACRDMGDPEYVRKMMTDLYKGREIVYDGMKVRFSYLSDSQLSDADDLETDEKRNDFPEKEILKSGLSKAAFWESLISDIDFSRLRVAEENGKQDGGSEEARLVAINKKKPGRLIRMFARVACVVLVVLTADYFLSGSKYENFKAEMVSSEGIKTGFNDFYRGFLAGFAGIKFGKTDKGEPVYIAANEPKAKKDKFYKLITPAGSEFIVQLPDSTLIWLNAATTIKYPANFDQDTIWIEADGEVYVGKSKDISHNYFISRSPVVGHRSSIRIDSSTAVNINTYSGNDEMLVTLIHGTADAKWNSLDNNFHFSDGQQAVFMKDSLASKRNVNANEISAWKNGEFNYRESTLSVMMPAIAKWYDVEVQYVSRIPDKKFSLQMPRSTPIDEVLDNLRKQGLRITQQGKMVTIWE